MRDDVFFDTNVLIYSTQPEERRFKAAVAELSGGGVISVQVLNEFVHVARRKFNRSWVEVALALADITELCPNPRPISWTTHRLALTIAERDGVAFYDAMIVAAALEAGCARLLSEDMQHGRVFDGRLTILNPFALPSPPADPASAR
jgi:predicted nucleic acid-binding protein